MTPELLPVKFDKSRLVLQTQEIPPQQWAVSSVCVALGLLIKQEPVCQFPTVALGL